MEEMFFHFTLQLSKQAVKGLTFRVHDYGLGCEVLDASEYKTILRLTGSSRDSDAGLQLLDVGNL